jgi:hypothetical protein
MNHFAKKIVLVAAFLLSSLLLQKPSEAVTECLDCKAINAALNSLVAPAGVAVSSENLNSVLTLLVQLSKTYRQTLLPAGEAKPLIDLTIRFIKADYTEDGIEQFYPIYKNNQELLDRAMSPEDHKFLDEMKDLYLQSQSEGNG